MICQNIYHSLVLCLKYLYKFLYLSILHIIKVLQNVACKIKPLNSENQNNLKPIPVVSGLPLLGTLFDLVAAGGAQKLHIYIDKRHNEYGCIFRERLGGTKDCIFVSSANLMRSIFMHEGSYPRHPLPEAWLLYNKENDCQRGLFFMDGEEWFQNRRILSRFLLNGNLDWMNWHVRQQSNKLIQKWHNELEKTIVKKLEIRNLEVQLYRWSIDVVISIMFGETSDLENTVIQKAVNDFSNIAHKIFESSTPLMHFPPKLAKVLNMKIWREFEQSVKEVLTMGCHVVDLFLEHTSAYPGGLYEKLQEAELPLDLIKRIFVDLVIAAGDTTAYSTTWALYLLSLDKHLQENIYKEYNSYTHQTPLVKGLVKETLRLFPVAPFIGRYMPQDCIIDNYYIKKDSLVFLSLFTAGRSDKHFPNPLNVMPERWLRNENTGELNAVYEPHATLPFAIGNRSCIGSKLALNQMQYMITEMNRRFHLICLNTRPVESILKMVTVPNQPINLFITKRRVSFNAINT